MKKNYFAVLIVVGILMTNTLQVYCEEIVPLNIETDNDLDIGHIIYPKTPIRIPSVGIENHTLYLYSGCDNATIEIVDENDIIVYTTNVVEGTEHISLPSYLSGTYEIRIVREGITFVGEITL